MIHAYSTTEMDSRVPDDSLRAASQQGNPRLFSRRQWLSKTSGTMLSAGALAALGQVSSAQALKAPAHSTQEVATSIKEIAERFFDACETGRGWENCQQYCETEATFSAQADALADIKTLQAYTEWVKGLLIPVPDGRYEVRSFAVDKKRNNVIVYAVFRGTHTGEDGPVPPTGRPFEADYVYVMQFTGDKIRHMTKIWNDTISLRQLGWA